MTTRRSTRRGLIVLALLGGVVGMHSLSVGHVPPQRPSPTVLSAGLPHARHDSARIAASIDATCTDNCPTHGPANGGPHSATALCLAVLSMSVALLLMASVRHRVRRAFRRQRTRAALTVELFMPGTPRISRLCVLRM